MSFKSWSDVDQALLRIGRVDRDVQEAEILMNDAIEHVKRECDAKATPLINEKRILEDGVRQFVKANARDLGEAKSRQLTYGVVGIKDFPPELAYLRGYNEDAIAALLVKRGLDQCVQVRRKVLKTAVKALELSEQKLEQLGLKLRQKRNQFYYVLDEKRVAEGE